MPNLFVKRPHRVSIAFPDDDHVQEYEEQIAYHVGDTYDEMRIGNGKRYVAWYFDTITRAEDFADTAALELSGVDHFTITIP